MRDLTELDRYRDRRWELKIMGGLDNRLPGDESIFGAFYIPAPKPHKGHLRVIASRGEGWDHVSVSRVERCPTWEEMEFAKRLFFKDDEVAMQLHVPVTEHISYHSYCLIWRPHESVIPQPPAIMVGPPNV